MKNISFGHQTDVGCKRDHNEDAFASHPELGLWVVADGMGGYDAGEIASAIAVRTIVDSVRNKNSLKQALKAAHEAILGAAEKGEGSRGMGTTAVALLLKDTQYEIAWVGDSRAYLFSKKLTQISRDHSFVQYMLDKGAITVKEAQNHPRANEITQALGSASGKGLRVDTIKGTLFKDEKILLCSDGLHGEVDDKSIQKVLKSGAADGVVVDTLINLAKKNGGSDNITAILVSAPEQASKKTLLAKGGTLPFDAAAFNRLLLKKKIFKWLLILLILSGAAFSLWWGVSFFAEDAAQIIKG